ncbi:MAG: polysulfide reductase NrfD [Desulforhopalus sp.]|nr:polysulfide reductase NrfD [Desulforhopalus sp.]
MNTATQKTAVTSLLASKIWWLSLAMIAAGVGAGLYALYAGHGEAFGNTREIPWGLTISVYTYFAIISTGLALLFTFSHAYGGNKMGAMGSRMVWLSLFMLLGAFIVIGLELESTWRLPLGFLLHPNFTSNIWWMGVLYGAAVVVMIIEILLILLRWYKTAVVLGVLCAIIEACAISNLGAVFSSLKSHPFWHGGQIPVFFLGSAVLSGAAALLVMTALSYSIQRRRMGEDVRAAMVTGGKIMLLMCFCLLLANVWKILNAYSGDYELIAAARSLTEGPLATNFWVIEIGIGLVAPIVLLMITHLRLVSVMAFSGVLVLVGQFISRFNMVVSGAVVPWDHGVVGVPTYLPYTATPAEYLVVLAGFGVVSAGFILGERFIDKTFMAEDSCR